MEAKGKDPKEEKLQKFFMDKYGASLQSYDKYLEL